MQTIPSPPLLATNLHVPQLHGELITRQSLMQKMDQVFTFPLTLISAPAGYGKTTLLSQWVSGSQNKNLHGRIAWISVESECDLRRFWTYILTALEEIQPGISETVQPLLETTQPPIHTILRILINEIAEVEDDFVLILDDYHQIDDPTVHTALTYLINNLPPNLHLVIASRSQPPLYLARWRASNQLFELREDDLRFAPEEVSVFLNEIRGLALSMEEVKALGARTEGWIAGLQLVALSIHGVDDTTKRTFVSEFTGSQRFILDYLVEEVLEHQPVSIKTFLLRTSVLDRLSAQLCNAVTGQINGQATLEHLERAQIFTIPLDHEQRWYRYHHLFIDVLRHRLQQTEPDSVLELHRRAAQWYIQAGRIEDAIRHTCAAQEWDQAVALMEPAIRTAWNRGEIRKIINWLGKLPDELLDSRIHLALYFSRALLLGGRMEAAKKRLRESEKALRARIVDHPNPADRLQLGTVCAFRTTVAAVTGETSTARTLGREALELLPPENTDIRAHAINSLGVNDYYLGNMVEAARACAEAYDLALQVGNLYLGMVAATYQAEALVCQGQLRRAGQILEQALSLSSSSNQIVRSWVPAASVACASFGNLLYEWNRLEEAERYLTDAIELGQQLAFGSALWSAYHKLAWTKLALGDRNGAETLIELAQRYRLTFSVPLPSKLMDAEHVGAQLALGHLEAADVWARTYRVEQPTSPGFVHEIEGITWARLHLLQGQPEPALVLLERLRRIAASNERQGHLIKVLTLTALGQQAKGETQIAISTLQEALRLAEPEGCVRTFVDEGQPMAALLYQALEQRILPDYVSGLLAVFSSSDAIAVSSPNEPSWPQASPAQKHPIEPLSPRELEVLQLISNGASNLDIAEELVIAMTTAKKHVSNIIQKLGVENRTQAAAKGRTFGLCE